DLHDLRDEAAETDAERDAAATPRRQRLAPSGSFRRDLHDVPRTRVLVKQGNAVGDGILLRLSRELIDEALDNERSASWPDAAPPACVHPGRWLLLDIVDMNGANVVRQIRRGLHRVPVNACFHRFRPVVARDDGGASYPMRPAHRLALRIQRRADAVVIVRAVQVVLNVLLARPDHLHRTADLLRDLYRSHRAIEIEAPAESTAQQMVVDAHLLAVQPRELHDRGLRHS